MKYRYILLIYLAVTSLVACNDDFLEKTPESSLSDSNYFTSISDYQLYLNQFYTDYIEGYQSGWSTSKSYPRYIKGSRALYGDMWTDNLVTKGSENSRYNGTYTTPTSSSSTGWDWGNIRNLNYFLVRYNNTDNVSDDDKQRYAAETKFFKAWDYYEKVLYFGDVPWLTRDLNTDSEELYGARDSREVVMDSVLACLNDAVAYLPEPDDADGRINKDQANFLKARICLFEGTFRKYHSELGLASSANEFLEECVTACEALMEMGRYSLFNDGSDNPYWQLFAESDVSSNPEVLLAREYNYTDAGVGHAAMRYYHQNNGGNYFALGATRDLVDEYLCIDGNPIYTGGSEGNYIQNENFEGYGEWTELNNRDPRLRQTIMKPGEYVSIFSNTDGTMDISNGIIYPTLTYSNNNAVVTGYRVIKKWIANKEEMVDKTTNGIQPCIVFRYAEVLLNYAEAKCELGTIAQSDIDNTINALRERVGFTAYLTIGQEPDDPRLEEKFSKYLDYSVSALLREIRRERRVEMMLDDLRYQDLMRWKAGNFLTEPLRGMNFEAVEDLYSTNNAQATVDKDVFVDDEGFLIAYPKSSVISNGTLPWSDYRYYWPIPIEELTLNPNLTQNDGWTGVSN